MQKSRRSLFSLGKQPPSIQVKQSALSHSAFELDSLVASSEQERFIFVQRLQSDWRSGLNRFDKPGEALFVATCQQTAVGVCGVNQDPYTNDRSVARLRHLYVAPNYRSHRIGRRLAVACVEFARPAFTTIRLRMAQEDTAGFYSTLGFVEVNCADTSHVMRL